MRTELAAPALDLGPGARVHEEIQTIRGRRLTVVAEPKSSEMDAQDAAQMRNQFGQLDLARSRLEQTKQHSSHPASSLPDAAQIVCACSRNRELHANQHHHLAGTIGSMHPTHHTRSPAA